MSYPVYFPPDADLENAKAVKRRRAALACTSCRRRKIRCDAAQPACGHCVKTGLECVYDDSKRRRIQRDAGDVEPHGSSASVDRRLRHLESMLTALLEKQGISMGTKVKDSDDHDLGDRSSDSSLDSDSESDSESDDQGGGKLDEKSGSTKADLFNLAERRGASHVEEGESPEMATADSIYSHGVTTAVLTPTCMRWLCTRVGNPELGKEAAGLLSWLWRQKALCEWPLKTQQVPDLDIDILRYCIDQYRKCSAMPLKSLLNNDDVDAAIIASNGSLELKRVNMESPYSLIFSTIVMLVTNDVRMHHKLGPFSPAQAAEQNRLAFVRGTRIASNLFMSHTTVLLLRLLVAFVYMMSYRAMLSQLRSLGSLALSMACTLGLQREETSRHLSPEALKRRKLLWQATQNIDIMLSLLLFQQPMASPSAAMTLTRAEWESDSALWPLQNHEQLTRIYMKAYQKVFSLQARKTSTYRLLRYILKYDSKLLQWEEELPTEMRDPVAAADEISRLYSAPVDENGRDLEPYELMDRVDKYISQVYTFVCYYHIVILLHSIPALTPSSLDAFGKRAGRVPERLQQSLEIISHSARMLLALLSHSHGLITEAMSAYLASNAFCVLFLKQIRQPRNPTNSDDVLLIYRFIINFRRQVTGPNTTMTSDISRHILSAWLILANAMTELNSKYQPSLPGSVQEEIRRVEEEALHNFESPFPSEMLHRRKCLQQLDLPKVTEPQGRTDDNQPSNTPLIPPQLVNFFTSEMRPRQAGQTPACPQARSSPLGQATAPAPGYPPTGHTQLLQLPLPTPQHTPPQVLPPIQSPAVAGTSAFPQPEGEGLLPRSSLPGGALKIDNSERSSYPAANDTQSGSSQLDRGASWRAMAPGMLQAQGCTAYSSPGDENALWDAFSGVRNEQSNVYEQAMQSVPIDPSANNDFVDDCIIA